MLTLQRILSLQLLVIYMSHVEGGPVRVPAATDGNKWHHAKPMYKTAHTASIMLFKN